MADKMELEELNYNDELKVQSTVTAGPALAQSIVTSNPAAAGAAVAAAGPSFYTEEKAIISEQKAESVTTSATTAAGNQDSSNNTHNNSRDENSKGNKKTFRWGKKAKEIPVTEGDSADPTTTPEEAKKAVSYLTLYRFATVTDKFYIA